VYARRRLGRPRSGELRRVPGIPGGECLQRRVYVTSSDAGHVLAFDSDTGDRLWTSKDRADGALVASPVVLDGRVYVCSSNGNVCAFSR